MDDLKVILEARNRLNEQLNARYSITLSVIADTYEEEGQPEIAAGYRYLIANGKEPGVSGECKDLYWVFTYDVKTILIACYLPNAAWPYFQAMPTPLSGARSGNSKYHFANTADAFRTAAICMGVVLAPKPHIRVKALLTQAERLWAEIPDNLKLYFPGMKVEPPNLQTQIERRKWSRQPLYRSEATIANRPY